jgi:hypothetical protein
MTFDENVADREPPQLGGFFIWLKNQIGLSDEAKNKSGRGACPRSSQYSGGEPLFLTRSNLTDPGPTTAIGEYHGLVNLHTAPAAQSLVQTIVDRAGHF